jgi:hypothetical protein
MTTHAADHARRRCHSAPGEDHVALNSERFYSESVNDVALVDWVSDLVAGASVDDVRCSDCR